MQRKAQRIPLPSPTPFYSRAQCGALESPQLACSSNFGLGLWQATDKTSATWRWQTAAKDKHSKVANFTDSVRFEKLL